MPIPNALVTFIAGDPLAAADLNANFANIDYLDAKINEQIQVGAGAMLPVLTNGAAPSQVEIGASTRNFAVLSFADGATQLGAEFSFVLPSDYDGGTMTAIFFWTANSTSTNSVVWRIAGRCFADDETLDAAMGTYQDVTDANKSTAYDLNISAATSAITIAGTPAAGKLVNFKVLRNPTDASDTLAAAALLISVVLTYTRS